MGMYTRRSPYIPGYKEFTIHFGNLYKSQSQIFNKDFISHFNMLDVCF